MSILKELRTPKFGKGVAEVFDHDFMLEQCKVWNGSFNSTDSQYLRLISAVKNYQSLRDEMTKKCGFVLWTDKAMEETYKIIGGEQWLEVMSGTGYFGFTMNTLYGTNIKMTDNMSGHWFKYANHTDVGVEKIDCIEAIEKYHSDVKGVIVSWPNYSEPQAFMIALYCIKHQLPLLYIGEDLGGCTGDDMFFEISDKPYFKSEYDVIESLLQFPSIYDVASLLSPQIQIDFAPIQKILDQDDAGLMTGSSTHESWNEIETACTNAVETAILKEINRQIGYNPNEEG